MARILSEGPSAPCDIELVSLLLGGDDLLAARLLLRGLPALARATPGELLFTPGISRRHAERVLAALELGRRVAHSPSPERPRLLHAADLAGVLWGKLVGLRHEEFWVILLTTRLQEIESIRVASGGITQCSISPREALAPALIHQAPAVAFVHNHPSGDPSPSAEDQRMQMLLDEAAHALGVRVIDHLVVAEAGFHSVHQGRCPPVSLVPREGVG
ncbi:MAG: RadC family protein [Myxococcales bacterium]|nr:DNA repair protein RadC [Myxococcales bacterium]